MNFAKRSLMVFGSVALAGLIGVLLTPKVARAVATLVQVVGNVSIVNPLDGSGNQTPLLIKDADSPVRSPFDVETVCTFAVDLVTNECLTQNVLSVPSGQVGKVEYAGVQCQTGNTPPTLIDLQDNASGAVQDHFLTVPAGSAVNDRPFGETMNFYVIGSAAANNGVRILIRGDGSTVGRCFVTISGYLAPQ